MKPKINSFLYDADLGYLKYLGDGPDGLTMKFKSYDKLQYGRWVETKDLCELTRGQFDYKVESGDMKPALSPL